MEKVKVTNGQLKLVTVYANEGYTLADLYEDCARGEYREILNSLGSDGLAKLWLGWYEVEETLADKVLKEWEWANKKLVAKDNDYGKGVQQGYIEALKFVMKLIEEEQQNEKTNDN